MNQAHLTQLQKIYSRSLQRGGVVLLQPDDAILLIGVARADGIRVLGVDGFFIGDKWTEPSMENSLDLSCLPSEADPCDIAISFIKEHAAAYKPDAENRRIYFEVVLDLTNSLISTDSSPGSPSPEIRHPHQR